MIYIKRVFLRNRIWRFRFKLGGGIEGPMEIVRLGWIEHISSTPFRTFAVDSGKNICCRLRSENLL
jgi:hypothetical protein